MSDGPYDELQERTNLVSKGSVPVLYGLSSDEDLTTLHYVACTLVRLGMEEQGHARMIQEGAARWESLSSCRGRVSSHSFIHSFL